MGYVYVVSTRIFLHALPHYIHGVLPPVYHVLEYCAIVLQYSSTVVLGVPDSWGITKKSWDCSVTSRDSGFSIFGRHGVEVIWYVCICRAQCIYLSNMPWHLSGKSGLWFNVLHSIGSLNCQSCIWLVVISRMTFRQSRTLLQLVYTSKMYLKRGHYPHDIFDDYLYAVDLYDVHD